MNEISKKKKSYRISEELFIYLEDFGRIEDLPFVYSDLLRYNYSIQQKRLLVIFEYSILLELIPVKNIFKLFITAIQGVVPKLVEKKVAAK